MLLYSYYRSLLVEEAVKALHDRGRILELEGQDRGSDY